MADVSNYKCPACGGPLVFSGAKQTLHCASCGNDYDAETLKMMDDTVNAAKSKSRFAEAF